MLIESFDWDDHNIQHIARHDVEPDEVEEMFESKVHLTRGKDGRYEVLGRSAAGRYLFCVLESGCQGSRVRVITARDMAPKERRLFKRKL